mmetsp:Transcript_23199/g.48731  ORF Transcript_23199/g.48731 Transcript_23199/m.48731 type:complete len:90 (-) Transcript_23199:41-310(-)
MHLGQLRRSSSNAMRPSILMGSTSWQVGCWRQKPFLSKAAPSKAAARGSVLVPIVSLNLWIITYVDGDEPKLIQSFQRFVALCPCGVRR